MFRVLGFRVSDFGEMGCFGILALIAASMLICCSGSGPPFLIRRFEKL